MTHVARAKASKGAAPPPACPEDVRCLRTEPSWSHELLRRSYAAEECPRACVGRRLHDQMVQLNCPSVETEQPQEDSRPRGPFPNTASTSCVCFQFYPLPRAVLMRTLMGSSSEPCTALRPVTLWWLFLRSGRFLLVSDTVSYTSLHRETNGNTQSNF